MAGDENPFRTALEASESDFHPFTRGAKKNLTKERQSRTIADLGIVGDAVLKRAPQIAELTVQDLEDLADEFSGVPSNNAKVTELSLEDLQELEGVFFEFKVAAGKDLAAMGRNELAAVDVSCCCCTPCCCCAATDMSHTA